MLYKNICWFVIYFLSKETKIKIKLNKTIRNRKKEIYRSLAETIKENMEGCYKSTKEESDIYNNTPWFHHDCAEHF